MAKEFFAHPETRQLFNTLEDISRRSKVSRAQAFEDVIRASVAALAAETMEAEYLDAVKSHTAGEKGERGVDLFPVFLGQTVDAMSRTDNDVLGDLFQGAISYGENGLYLTPQPIAELLARMTADTTEESIDQQTPVISDPCCGTGILLMEAGKVSPCAELVGQDSDGRCVRIAGLNLGLRGKYGWIICGNTLTREVEFAYRIGSFFHEGPNGLRRGVIRQVSPEQCPVLPELRKRTNHDLPDTVDDEPPSDPPAEQQFPTIIEIPDWALRIEQRLTVMEQTERSGQELTSSEPSSTGAGEGDSDDEPPNMKQQQLF